MGGNGIFLFFWGGEKFNVEGRSWLRYYTP